MSFFQSAFNKIVTDNIPIIRTYVQGLRLELLKTSCDKYRKPWDQKWVNESKSQNTQF